MNRCYYRKEFGPVTRSEVHAFSDASEEASGVAVYLTKVSETGQVRINLAFSQAKVAPIRVTNIPRLELCGAVLSTKAAAVL